MMKKLVFCLITLAMLAAACNARPTAAPTQAPAPTTASTEPAPSAAATDYPAPVVTVGPQPTAGQKEGYPPPGTPVPADWPTVQSFMQSGQVTQVIQSSSLTLVLTLIDGRQFMTTEPAFDDVVKFIQQCGAPCKNIQVINQ
jgi:hypothetical protein